LQFIESKYVYLLGLVPALVDTYEGVDNSGCTMRIYTISAPEVSESSEDDFESDIEDEGPAG
jgi:hypothetical protein